MSTHGVAYAIPARIPVATIARGALYAGAIVEIKVPVGATRGSYPDGDKQVLFWEFSRCVPGGFVNIFVHTENDVRGKTITAMATVLKKTLEDGREYMYVDLTPVSNNTPVTHRLAVMKNMEGSWETAGHLIFKTPSPLNGVIILGPPDAKMVTVVQVTPPAPAKALSTSGDVQLDRLLAAGWEITSQNTKEVQLSKTKLGLHKTMTHHRPKNGCK